MGPTKNWWNNRAGGLTVGGITGLQCAELKDPCCDPNSDFASKKDKNVPDDPNREFVGKSPNAKTILSN